MVIGLSVSCGGSDERSDSGVDAGKGGKSLPACVERSEKYSTSTTFEQATAASGIVNDCAPTCSQERSADGFYFVSALPAGSCDSNQRACQMEALSPCACPEGRDGVVNGYQCRCESGSWKCENVYPAAAACPACK